MRLRSSVAVAVVEAGSYSSDSPLAWELSYATCVALKKKEGEGEVGRGKRGGKGGRGKGKCKSLKGILSPVLLLPALDALVQKINS